MFYRGKLLLHPSVCITPKPELTSKEGIGYTNFAMLKLVYDPSATLIILPNLLASKKRCHS